VNSLNWPVTAADVPLEAGKWKFELAAVDEEFTYTRGVPVDLAVLLSQDSDFTTGTLNARVFYAGTADSDAELKRAMEEAIEIWRGLYALIGLDLVVRFDSWPQGDLATPGVGNAADYLGMSEQAELGEIVVVVAPDLRSNEPIYGVSGGIPGPLVPSERSAVAISALTNAGPDGVFDPEEERLLGESLAHEVLHYLGLFHVVEDSWDTWDAIEDTVQCETQSACLQQASDNLMFPYPVCTSQSCRPQDELTRGQGGVAHRYVGVD
jgi:hypothetical protein